MHTVSAQGLSLAFGDRDILSNLSFTINSISRISLSGANGSGKTTLMKVLSGIMEPDSGTVGVSKGTMISYLPQAVELNTTRTLYCEAESAFDRFLPLLEQRKTIETSLQKYSSGNPPPNSLIHELDLLHQQLLSSSYYDRERHIYSVLLGLGFSIQDLSRSCLEFSGGWKMRIALAKILLSSPDILLLDEPTNYLDIDARIWLTGFLKEYPGGIMLVSHDRQFLDDTVKEIWSIHHGRITRFTGSYSQFEVFQKEETEKLLKAYEMQQKEIERIEQFINRFRYKASKASQVQSRITYLEKIRRIEIPPYLKRISFSFPNPQRTGTEVMRLKNLGKSYGALDVFKSFTLDIRRGDRIAVTGRNGAGKSTLIRIIAGVDPSFDGERNEGKDVTIGYFHQEIDEVLHGSHTVYDEVCRSVPESLIPSVRGSLGAFLFHGDDAFKPINVLSGGEKSRLQLLKLLLQNCSLLVLDEPTNHLDITSKEVLLEALKQYRGTLIYVSHDQAFIRELSEKIIYFSREAPKVFDGDYDYFLWKISCHEPGDEPKGKPLEQHPENRQSSQDHREQKKMRNRLRSLESEEHDTMMKIEKTEEEIEEIHRLMSLPEHYQDGKRMREFQERLAGAQETLETLMETWNNIHEELESTREVLI